jgi:dTDP-4-amino-4,6-dideoxygalactose transaminase
MVTAVERVLNSGWYILGKEVEYFENEWSNLCGTNFTIGVGNGMDAIEIALRSLNIGPGSEVITTPMTAFATVLAIIRSGATPVLADIDINTGILSIESVKRCITINTKAVVLVHLYGQLRNMRDWQSICHDFGIELIEDCAQAHLAKIDGKVAGSFGRVGAFSFYPTKNLGAPGDAGAIVTDEKEIAEIAFQLRNYGQSERYHHPVLGLNSRLDELQAAILRERLKWLTEFTQRRQEIASAYFKGIKNPKVNLLAPPEEPLAHVYHLFVITCVNRDALQIFMSEQGVQTLIHYPVPIHEQKPCLEIKRDPYGLTNSKVLSELCLSIPCHPQMTEKDVNIVINALNRF